MNVYIDEPENAEPLTAEEMKWLKSFGRLMDKAPKRFGLYTIGDPSLHIYDQIRAKELGVEEDEQEPARAGLQLANITWSGEGLQGWCG